MSEHTQTMWIILSTPQKKILAKVSRLKAYGKIKIGEWKVMYGKNKVAGWVFRVLGQPSSRTFSFHDGEVILKTEQGYAPLRKFGFHFYLAIGFLCCAWLSWSSIYKINLQPKPKIVEKISEPVEVIKEMPIQSKEPAPVVRTYDPQFHEIFLDAKRSFQFGNIDSSSKLFQVNLDNFNPDDRAMASRMISERYYIECEKWIGQNEDRKAVLACEKSVKFSPHEKASAYLRAQDEKAKKLYLEGYTAVKLSPLLAKQKFTQVLQVAKSKSTWRGKAQYQLRKMKKIQP